MGRLGEERFTRIEKGVREMGRLGEERFTGIEKGVRDGKTG